MAQCDCGSVWLWLSVAVAQCDCGSVLLWLSVTVAQYGCGSVWPWLSVTAAQCGCGSVWLTAWLCVEMKRLVSSSCMFAVTSGTRLDVSFAHNSCFFSRHSLCSVSASCDKQIALQSQ